MSDDLVQFARQRLDPTPVPEGLAEGWLTERMKGIVGYQLRIKRTLHSERSPYQQIDLLESYHHGKVMVLDGCLMLTELDEFVYHEMLTHVGAAPLGGPRRAVVVGGGDGGAVGELLKYERLEEVTLAEIDERVVRLSQEHLPEVAKGLSDPRCRLRFEDGAAVLASAEAGSLDLVAVDSTDPVGPARSLVTEDFYRAIDRSLAPGGVLVAQTQSPFYHPTEIVGMYETLGKVFKNVYMYWAICPAYVGFLWTFCFASQERHPLEGLDISPMIHKDLGTRYYSEGVHRGAFALPPFVQALLPEGHPQRLV